MKEKLEALVAEMIEKHILLDEAVGAFEKKFIQTALEKTQGNQSKAAEVLGVHRNTLSRKISLHKVNGPAVSGFARQRRARSYSQG